MLTHADHAIGGFAALFFMLLSVAARLNTFVLKAFVNCIGASQAHMIIKMAQNQDSRCIFGRLYRIPTKTRLESRCCNEEGLNPLVYDCFFVMGRIISDFFLLF